jgi:adenylate kinase
MKSGALVPDRLITGFILKRIGKYGKSNGYVLDGFPRNVEQAKDLDRELIGSDGAPIDLVIDFQVSPETVVKRLVGRRVCEKCRVNYHVERIPPKQEGICDRCGSKVVARPDDQPETVRKRLAVFEEQTAPLIDFYKQQGKLRVVSGDQRIDDQYQELIDLLRQEKLLVAK